MSKYSLITQEKILGRLESAKAKYSEGSLFEYKLTKDRKGLFHLTWKISTKKLEETQGTGRRVRAEDEPAGEAFADGEGLVQVQGAKPGGTAVSPLQRPVGGGPDVPGKAGANGRAGMHRGLGVDGDGLDGASDAAELERQADVWAVPGEPSQPGTHRPGHPEMLQHAVYCDRQRTRQNLATLG